MIPPILHGKFYHIYNRGNNKEKIFIDDADYAKFLELYETFMNSVANTISYCLIGNHFHILLQIKNSNEIGYLIPEFAKSDNLKLKWSTTEISHRPTTSNEEEDMSASRKQPNPSEQFKHFFSTYTKYFNKKHNRSGSILEKKFERIQVEDYEYLQELVLYINNNPVKHGITKDPQSYKWSSLNEVINPNEPQIIDYKFLLELFGDKENFLFELKRYQDRDISSSE